MEPTLHLTKAPATGVEETLGKLCTAIWQRRPILGEIMQRHGGKILADYSRDFMDVNKSPLLDARKDELIAETEAMVTKRLGAKVAKGVAKQLKKLPLVSTADHHAPIDHPFWVNANLISALPTLELHDKDVDINYLVVFSFASVSLNNASGFPRGIQFYGGTNGSKNILRVPILPDKIKMSVVHNTRGYTKEEIDKTKQAIRQKEREGSIAQGRGEAVCGILDQYFGNDDVLGTPLLNEQITKINYALWPRFFHPAEGQQPEQGDHAMPDLLYLEIETLVTNLLKKRHLDDTTTSLHRVLFDTALRPEVLELFEAIPGAFSTVKNWGTYFFWGIDDKRHRVRLKLEGEKVVSEDGKIVVPFTSAGVRAALDAGTIYPSMLLCYLMVSLYYGMKCLGGFCQVNDLTFTKRAWTELLRRMGEEEEAAALEPVQTKELGGDGMVLAYIRSVEGAYLPASGIDMMLNPRDTRVEKYIERSRVVTLQEMMNPMLPEMYTVLYSQQDRDPTLLTVTPEQILVETGLQEKLVAMNTQGEAKK